MRRALAVFLAFAGAIGAAEKTPGAPAGTRIVRHAMGETPVPPRATRVVALSYESTESVLVLGLVPVGAVVAAGGKFYPQVAAALATTRTVGTEDAPDLVAIAALHPDLILGLKLRQAAIYPQFTQIAPTVFCETLRGQWQANLKLWAAALGRESEATTAFADWQQRLAVARRALPEAAHQRVAVLRFMPKLLRIYHRESFAMSILAELGFRAAEFSAANDYFEELPTARLGELTSTDAIFYFTWDDGDGAALQRERELTASTAWTTLPAMQAGRAFRVDDGIWNTGGGMISARLVVAELVQRLDPSVSGR